MILAEMENNKATHLNPLLLKLIAKQGKQSDYKFADYLQITRPLWQLTRTGKALIGLTLLRAVVRVYPELRMDVLYFLGGEDHEKEPKE
jgi:hypothetical protein